MLLVILYICHFAFLSLWALADPLISISLILCPERLVWSSAQVGTMEWSRVGLALLSWFSKAGITLGSRSLGDYPSTLPT